MNFLGPEIQSPEWIDGACRYYSRIERDRNDSVRVMKPPDEGDASETNPGTLCIRLAAGFREVRVLDAAGNEEGVIRPRGPGFGYALRRSGRAVWTVSNRSSVMRRHVLDFSGGGTWDVRTPFFWWMNIMCSESGKTHALGQVGPRKWLWFLWIEPGKDDLDVLSALAFMHRRWWRL
jgi:hypothetical protein